MQSSISGSIQHSPKASQSHYLQKTAHAQTCLPCLGRLSIQRYIAWAAILCLAAWCSSLRGHSFPAHAAYWPDIYWKFKSIMASRILDDCDGVYVENDDSLDQVDASQVFQIVRTEDIPYRYSRNSKEGGGWKKDKATRLRMVSDKPRPHICFSCTTASFCADLLLFCKDTTRSKSML